MKYLRCRPITLFGKICDFLSNMSFVDTCEFEESNEERFSRKVIACSTTSVQNCDISFIHITLLDWYLYGFIHTFSGMSSGHVEVLG